MIRRLNETQFSNMSRADMISKIIDTYLYETEEDAANNDVWFEGHQMIEEAFDWSLCVDLEILEDGNWDITEGFFEPITTEGIEKVYQYLQRHYPM